MKFPLTSWPSGLYSIALDYAIARKWSWFKTREHQQGFLYFKFYFKNFDDARVF